MYGANRQNVVVACMLHLFQITWHGFALLRVGLLHLQSKVSMNYKWLPKFL